MTSFRAFVHRADLWNVIQLILKGFGGSEPLLQINLLFPGWYRCPLLCNRRNVFEVTYGLDWSAMCYRGLYICASFSMGQYFLVKITQYWQKNRRETLWGKPSSVASQILLESVSILSYALGSAERSAEKNSQSISWSAGNIICAHYFLDSLKEG